MPSISIWRTSGASFGKGNFTANTSALISYKMLTPVFELSQDDEFVLVIIKTPYVKVELDCLQVRT